MTNDQNERKSSVDNGTNSDVGVHSQNEIALFIKPGDADSEAMQKQETNVQNSKCRWRRYFMRSHNQIGRQNLTQCQSFWHMFLCPPEGQVNEIVTVGVLLGLLYLMLLSISPNASLPPSSPNQSITYDSPDLNLTHPTHTHPYYPRNGSLLFLYLLFVGCLLAGYLVSAIHLPELLGMLVMGILLRNLPLGLWSMCEKRWVSILRRIAFVVILIQGGLGLDVGALRRLKAVVLKLAFLPCVFEAATVAIASHLILGFPWIPGLLMGFVLGAVSPAVCVPSMLELQKKGYGIREGIPTLVIAASSTDDVLAITAFSVLLSVAFAQGGLALTIIRGPLDLAIGVIYGIALGFFVRYFPDQKSGNCNLHRFLLILFGGMVSMFGSSALGIDGAGALGCLVSATVAANGWRQESQESDPDKEPVVSSSFAKLWTVSQPFLFGLIGAEIDLSEIQFSKIGLCCLILIIALVVRSLVAFMAVFGANFSIKDQVFITIAWLPKATVQAALGSIYYDTAVENDPTDTTNSNIGLDILTMAVLSILLTAPVGAVFISLLGPKLLKNTPVVEENAENVDTLNIRASLS